jgi:peptidoglycan/LPS O-acetylase OafA/YrhL
VEGLRAVAILLVVLYHCGGWLHGGFVGVDVFFVISGFLITGQLIRELQETGTISLVQFYARRARRILPAATLTTIVTVVASGLLLAPTAALRVFGDARAAAIFGANIHFAARGADYFNATLPPSPLQHYWSLSVEEQFYLVWPLLLACAALIRPRVRVPHSRVIGGGDRTRGLGRGDIAHPRLQVVMLILGILATMSLAASVMQTPRSPVSAYYSIVTRAWELAAGALVALAVPTRRRLDRRVTVALTWLGLAGIAVAAVFCDDSTPYPGSAALLPVAGTVAVIAGGSGAAGRHGAVPLLGTAPLQRIGAWSYSWYLWHWPLLLLAPALLTHSLSRLEALMLAAISLVIAAISFIFIERPIRRMQFIVRRPTLALAGAGTLVATSLLVVALAVPVFAQVPTGPRAVALTPLHGSSMSAELATDLREGLAIRRMPSNLEPSVWAAAGDKPLIATNGCQVPVGEVKSPECVYGDTSSRTNVVLFGDSHAAAWFPAVNLISEQQHWRLVVLTKSGCSAAAVNLVRFGQMYTNCPVWRTTAEHQIAALHPALVIVAYSQSLLHGARPLAGVPGGYGSTWANGTEATFSFLHRSAARVVFITDVPMLSQSAPDCVSGHASDVRACTAARTTAIQDPQVTAEEMRLAAQNQIQIVNSTQWFCTRTKCPIIVGNILLYRDAEHMVPEWSLFLEPLLAAKIVPLLASQPPA